MATDDDSQSAVDLAGLLAFAPPPLVPINAKELQHELDDHVDDKAHARQYDARNFTSSWIRQTTVSAAVVLIPDGGDADDPRSLIWDMPVIYGQDDVRIR